MSRSVLNTTPTAERPYISKSKFLWGHPCRKLLWFAYNAKDEIPEPDAARQAIFEQGHEVSAGVTDFEQVLRQSLESAKVIKAGFISPNRQKLD